MTTFRIRFEGPSLLALDVATWLADVDGVDLTGSEPPSPLGGGIASLVVTVDGEPEVVTDAVAGLRRELPPGASIEVVGA
jgi:hypothetical protein